MGHEPIVKCRCCDEPLDVYQSHEDRFCSDDCRTTQAEYDANVGTTRRAPHMEQYVSLSPVVMEGSPDAHNVHLQIGNQRFCVSPHGCETKDEAEWMRDMLCIALDNLVKKETSKSA